MASYRMYCLDRAGRIGFAEWLEAEDDSEALALARNLKEGVLKCEVWRGNRLVSSLSHEASPRPSLSAELRP